VAAVAVARSHGLRVDDPVILRDQLNVLVHLRPAPVVARVAGTIAAVRPGTTWQARELSVAGHLARAGAPVVAPSAELPPGPHEYYGRVLSFWDYAPPAEVDAATTGEALTHCHEALRSYRGSLPLLGTISEAEALLARLAAEERIEPDAATSLLLRFQDLIPVLSQLRSPVQPLHGDAHLGNVLGGPLWNDWEDTCLLRPRTPGGGLRRLPHGRRSGGAEAVDRSALAADVRVALRRGHQVAVGLHRHGR
jgi:hypothetical protein